MHLPTKNDIIFLLRSQSEASTWSPAFRAVLCTQERQKEKERDGNRCGDRELDRQMYI